KERRVEWSEQIPELDDSTGEPSGGWPGICGAAWDDPNEQAQKRLLGKVGITGDALFDYNLWYQGLSSQEKQEWDAFLPTVRGDVKLADRLEEFRFSDEHAGRKGAERVASSGTNALSRVLQPHKEGAGQIWINGVPLFPKRPEPKKQVDPLD
ncbi:MAG TPA: hypothetical protein VGP63_07630, partial [Planctomycetaceae bacterium]|nr:hypothetical protein [Planctomycetaceae bacterium]